MLVEQIRTTLGILIDAEIWFAPQRVVGSSEPNRAYLVRCAISGSVPSINFVGGSACNVAGLPVPVSTAAKAAHDHEFLLPTR